MIIIVSSLGQPVVVPMFRSMITKNFVRNAAACRELFFSEDLPQADLEKYQALLRDNASPVPVIDVGPRSRTPTHLP